MSRSKKKIPILGNCGGSDKQDKRKANRIYRRVIKELIAKDKELPQIREISNVWSFNKDGKRYITNCKKEWLRK